MKKALLICSIALFGCESKQELKTVGRTAIWNEWRHTADSLQGWRFSIAIHPNDSAYIKSANLIVDTLQARYDSLYTALR